MFSRVGIEIINPIALLLSYYRMRTLNIEPDLILSAAIVSSILSSFSVYLDAAYASLCLHFVV